HPSDQGPVHAAAVRLKLYRGIESQGAWVSAVFREALDAAQEEVSYSFSGCLLSPDSRGRHRVRDLVGAVDQEQRLAFEPDVARITEGIEQPADVPPVVLRAVLLRHQELLFAAIPASRPVLVRPAE